MKESDRKYIDDLIRHTEETIRFLSNEMKPYRERCVCAALLRCLGITFSPAQIQSNRNDPPDVFYTSASFEIIELYDKRRKRLAEYKARLEELKRAKSIDDTLVNFPQPEPISYQELNEEISRALGSKSRKYDKKLCSTLDALVYIGLPSRFLDITSVIPDFAGLINQGWRSASFVILPFSHVAFCRGDGPQFLSAISGQTKQEWKEAVGYFELE
jgi:hypothetical protein